MHSPSNLGFTRIRHVVLGALLGAGLSGCAAQSEMTNQWHDPALAPNSIHKVFVVAIRKNPVRRREWEDAFAAALTARGVSATPSYRLYADAPPDTQDVIQAVRRDGYDAVLTCVRLPDVATSRYVPGTVRAQPMSTRDYYGRFHTYWMDVQEPGYTETDKVFQVQTDVWAVDGGSGRLVSSSTLRTLESTGTQSIAKAVTKKFVPELEKQGVIAGPAR